jgi:hypothetical protein
MWLLQKSTAPRKHFQTTLSFLVLISSKWLDVGTQELGERGQLPKWQSLRRAWSREQQGRFRQGSARLVNISWLTTAIKWVPDFSFIYLFIFWAVFHWMSCVSGFFSELSHRSVIPSSTLVSPQHFCWFGKDTRVKATDLCPCLLQGFSSQPPPAAVHR